MSSLLEQVRARRAELAAAGEVRGEDAPVEAHVWDDDLLPDLGDSDFKRSKEDEDIDTLLAGIGIVDAYTLWCGKSVPKLGKRRESIMVSCPNPQHPDKVPSAWLNSDKDVYTCGGCGFEGGDKYDIAAWHFGFAKPGYKTDGSFPDLRRRMAEDLGYTVHKTPTGHEYVSKAEDEPSTASGAAGSVPGAADDAPLAPVLTLAPPPPLPPELNVSIAWRDLIPYDTFLAKWMRVCCTDDLPEEYYFWLGLMAVGFSGGDDAVLEDNPLVKPNLNICLYGPTGIGKSRSMRALSEVLNAALPYDPEDNNSTGICQVAQPGSAEALLDNFSKPKFDPADPKVITGYAQVRGLLQIDELSDLMGKAARQGNVLKPLLMRLYDGYGNIDHRSRGYGYVRAERPFCSTVTTTQPRAIRDLLVQTDADSGFVNRWVFASGQPKKLVAIGRKPLDITSTVPLLQRLRTWTSSGRRITLDDAARAAWENFFEENIEPIKIEGDSSLLTRCDLTLKKLMLLFAVNEQKDVIDANIVERVLTLWPYLRDTYEMLSGEIGLGEFEDCRIAMLNFIDDWTLETGSGPSPRDLSRKMARRHSRKLMLDVLRNLESMGEIKETKVKSMVRYSRAG